MTDRCGHACERPPHQPCPAVGHLISLDASTGWDRFYPTPWDDTEFTAPGDQGEQGRMDLLTVLEHELGHLLGRDHEADGVMQETLAARTRRIIGPAVADDLHVGGFLLFGVDPDFGTGDGIVRNGMRK